MKKKLLALVLAVAMAVCMTACGSEESRGKTNGERTSVSMSLDSSGSIKIERPTRSETIPMGDDGTWTVFVYLCGTDLESENGMAAMDMEEMQSASTGENVRFVVQTGGTSTWSNDVSSDCLQRYEICGGETTLIEEADNASMGESSTLADFLRWGVENYKAANMGLVFWNHGGGSVTGVCFDETNDNDSLTLKEIDAALLSVYDSMTDNFEFIGFDACLMGTVECANILASYANYMYGSQELEPGYGWDYKVIGDFLGENPTADGEQLGKAVADGFYESCAQTGEESSATLSVTKLSEIDALLTAFNDYAKDLYTAAESESVLAQVVRSVSGADNFGGNNKSEGYTNMVDLGGIVNAGADCADGADSVISAIENAVVYVKNGPDHTNACGLSAYYPLQIQGSSELETFGQIAVSPYYLSFVDRAAQSAASGSSEDYDNSQVVDSWGVYDYSLDDSGNYTESADSYNSDYWSYYDSNEQTGESSAITFASAPAIDSDGSYTFTLTEDALNQTQSVQASVYTLSDDGKDLIELGLSAYISADWEYGEFSDNFDGCWFSLPDGQMLAAYIVSECDGYDVYTSPVYLNGEETNLRITHDYTNGKITIDGVWGGIDDNGMANRETTELSKGDELVPMYYSISVDTEEESIYQGDTYVYDGTSEISYDYLPDGEFFYGFCIDDIYSDYYVTDYVQFSVEGENVYFYTEE